VTFGRVGVAEFLGRRIMGLKEEEEEEDKDKEEEEEEEEEGEGAV
jgi:hypothetical protein